MNRQPLVKPPEVQGPGGAGGVASAPGGSPTLSPNQHVRTIVELLKPAGPDLARRWLAALLLVPVEERGAVVASIEAAVVRQYPLKGSGKAAAGPGGGESAEAPTIAGPTDERDQEFIVVYPATQRQGFVEQIERAYGPAGGAEERRKGKKRRRA